MDVSVGARHRTKG